MLWCGLALALALGGCAAKPENIQPAYVSHMVYQAYTIEQLGEEETRLQAALSTSSNAQRQARSNDTMGVIFLGLPVSSLSGSNQAATIARLKGELEAVQKAIILKRNTLAPAMGTGEKPVVAATEAK